MGISFSKKSRIKSLKEKTFLTDSAISGPIPSPGNKVAVIGVVDEQKALAAEVAAVEVEFTVPRICVVRDPISRLAKFAAMVISFNAETKNDSTDRELFCVRTKVGRLLLQRMFLLPLKNAA